jgi:hypothetical protein
MRFGWQQFTPESDSRVVDWWLNSRRIVAKLHQKAFNLVVLLGAWMLWLERNVRTFSSNSDTVLGVAAKVGE